MAAMTSRRLRILTASALLLSGTVLLGPGVPVHAADANQDLIDAVCSMPKDYLTRTWRGFTQDRGAEISYVAKEPNFVGSGLPHVGPWPYIQDVPMLWYGPGYIKAQGQVDRPVTLADIAPTQAALMNFDGFNAPDGTAMTEALDPSVGAPDYQPPKLEVTLVWDAGGVNVLKAHPDSWPFLKSLIDQGTYFSNATVGLSPTSTAQSHATIGTGAFPDHHGIVGHHFRVGPTMVEPWGDGPAYFVLPTFADVYDLAKNNEPVVGIVATADIHYGMLGHGSFWHGGDRDIGITRSVANPQTSTEEGTAWNLPPKLATYFELADYVNNQKLEDVLKAAVDQLDIEDGQDDEKWRQNSIEELADGFETPAKIPYEEAVLETILKEEQFGQDDVPDLLYTNFKQIDYVSHIWSMNSPEMQDSVVYQDAALKRLVTFLDDTVGNGNYVLNLTADHGAMTNPDVSGGYQISNNQIEAAVESAYDTDGDDIPVVDLVQPSNMYVNVAELEENGGTLEDVSRTVLALTQSETEGSGITAQPGHENDLVFQSVFPTAMLADVPCWTPPKDTSPVGDA
jgi:arylsulfatase A-like enzyme